MSVTYDKRTKFHGVLIQCKGRRRKKFPFCDSRDCRDEFLETISRASRACLPANGYCKTEFLVTRIAPLKGPLTFTSATYLIVV